MTSWFQYDLVLILEKSCVVVTFISFCCVFKKRRYLSAKTSLYSAGWVRICAYKHIVTQAGRSQDHGIPFCMLHKGWDCLSCFSVTQSPRSVRWRVGTRGGLLNVGIGDGSTWNGSAVENEA